MGNGTAKLGRQQNAAPAGARSVRAAVGNAALKRARSRPAAMIGGAVGLASLVAVIAPGLIAASAPAEVAAVPKYLDARAGVTMAAANGRTRIDYRRLDERLTIAASKPDIVGMAVAVIENGEITFLKGYGVTQAAGGEPVGPQTVFRWASLSKGVASTLVGLLAAEGRLSLDEPVARFSTSLKLPNNGEQTATIADILSHRVGIPHNASDNRLEAGADPRSLRQSLAAIAASCTPGTCHSYQNIAFDTTTEVVERVTGQSYAEQVRRRLFAPLGMRTASLTRAGLMAAQSWARPHVGRRTVEVNDNYYRVPAAGGVNSSIMDLALWMRAQMGLAPQVVPPAVLANIHQARVDTGRRGTLFSQVMGRSQYALGWRDYDYSGRALVGHQGAVMGYRSTILFDPAARSGVAVLWNSQSGRPVGVQLEVLEMLYGQPPRDWLKIDGPAGAMAAQ
ncbi:serine hydrolase [Sphingomonas changnyeongensis]|uniref:Serine hydrolase n=1 Tax=Sphingomonas changnyeongensis TaxID=2698679 RepID=A0A7Z2S6B5_9SPHN|nr:serine hydrolase domain-containing protein [Sphingomonas changnyeongensis]QHL91318.1 serine hydrolase [Sphingomonas changnyeongensis]